LLEVFAWSLQILLGGQWPALRHDGDPLDTDRAALAGQPLGFHGLLMQARGDWEFYSKIFQFPKWNNGQICWRCRATRTGETAYTHCGPGAAWRRTRYRPGEFLKNQARQGLPPSPLFRCPGFTTEFVCIGVLHCLDLGVSQDILGNVLWEAVNWLGWPGNQANRVHQLWVWISQYYKDTKAPNKLEGLTLGMLRRPSEAPKLRAKGAQTRHLVPFGVLVAKALWLHVQCDHTKNVLDLATALLDIHQLMARGFDAQAALALSVRLFTLYEALCVEASAEGILAWRMKPKTHMAQELLEYQAEVLGNPRGFWEYPDEDFVGQIAELAMRRGGAYRHTPAALNVLRRYRALL
jgi:hypothetical protein